MKLKRTCPECHLIFEAALPETGVFICPLCNTPFSALPLAGPAPPLSAASGRQVLRGVLAVGALLSLIGGFGYAYHLMSGIGPKTATLPAPRASAPSTSASPPVVETIPVVPAGPTPQEAARQPSFFPRPKEFHPRATPQEMQRPLTLEENVNRAIDRGLVYLRRQHNRVIQYRKYIGLVGLTLLECGSAADETTVQQIAAAVRACQRELTQTYELTLAILFLDRLGDPRDRALIRSFGQRLLSGQLDCGAWTYSFLVNDRTRARADVPPDLPYLPPLWHRPRYGRYGVRPFREQRIVYRGDNSNTQFAILGLWVAQRHGAASRSALLAAEQYFRDTQAEDGSWAYHPNMRNWRDSMTCAGLMSLAMRYGVISGQGRDIRPDRPIHVHDAAINRGLRYLAQSLDKISVVGDRILGAEARDPLYFLWSLERMAVIFDLKKIGRRQWYPWAAQMLVEAQGPDGRWPGMAEPAATCFALLVLKRSNFAKDLQLTVQEAPSRPMPDISGPIILQGPDAFLGQTAKPKVPAPPLGPSITQTPAAK